MNARSSARILRSLDVNAIDDDTLAQILNLHNPAMREAHAEYVRRQAATRTPAKQQKISASQEAANYLMPLFFELEVEQFHILLLNRANYIIGTRQISAGGMSGTVVDPKVIFYKALQAKASGIILSHNHPSGNLRPSEADIQLTKKLRDGGRLLEIAVLDHLIVANNRFYSFADEGAL